MAPLVLWVGKEEPSQGSSVSSCRNGLHISQLGVSGEHYRTGQSAMPEVSTIK
jgi:hypothetical protein